MDWKIKNIFNYYIKISNFYIMLQSEVFTRYKVLRIPRLLLILFIVFYYNKFPILSINMVFISLYSHIFENILPK